MTIQTAALAAMMQHAPPASTSTGRRLAPFALAFLLLFGMGSLRRNSRALRRMLCVVALLLGGMATTLLSGCGADGYFSQALHTYTITITFTAAGVTHTETVTLIVQ